MDRISGNKNVHNTREYLSLTPTNKNDNLTNTSNEETKQIKDNTTTTTNFIGIASNNSNNNIVLKNEPSTPTTSTRPSTTTNNNNNNNNKSSDKNPIEQTNKCQSSKVIQTNTSKAASALSYSDEELIILLRDKPKNREELRTERNYKNFFTGVQRKNMERLLNTAYSNPDLPITSEECEAKVRKRMKLLEDVLID
eukprot:TRINITY_DN65895_c10_g1_i3.p1 TRINITY_DN65895_c10_g1~~TRINITY_DN65895_c10_g1_i3.p1  ORF type:complete len:227 (-),score=9.86 TRINITY_DN65895_c10_g1_i3:49-636(-)